MNLILRCFTGLSALLFAALGGAFLIVPDRIIPQFAIAATGVAGYAAFRGDLAAVFFALAIFTIAGLRDRRWLAVPATILGAIVVGRIVSMSADGRSAENLRSLLLEVVLFAGIAATAFLGRSRLSKVALLIPLLIVFSCAAAAYLFQRPIGMTILKRTLDTTMSHRLSDSLGDGLHAGLCGSGSPLADPHRAGPCVFVVAGPHMYIVDAGDGGTRKLTLAGFQAGDIDGIFLTHFHSDHIGGLGEMMIQRWAAGGHDQPVDVYGPQGVESVVEGFNAAYKLDSGYRVAHHGAATVPPTGAGGTARPFTVAAGSSQVILDRDGLTVTAFAVEHTPVFPAVGYRFDYRGRSVVISGDTAPSPELEKAAHGVDILFHEGLQTAMVSAIHDAAAAHNRRIAAKIMADIPSYHTTPEDAARIAERAGVRRVVMYHIIPALPFGYLQAAFLGDAAKLYHGPITVGKDGMMFSLPAGSSAITLRELL